MQKYHFVRRVGRHLRLEIDKYVPKSAKCALSMVLLHVSMVTLVE